MKKQRMRETNSNRLTRKDTIALEYDVLPSDEYIHTTTHEAAAASGNHHKGMACAPFLYMHQYHHTST